MSSEDEDSLLPSEIAIPRIVRFWIMIPFYIPSVICSFFILYHSIADRKLRQALHNHVIILLLIINLIVELTNIPWILNYYRSGDVWLHTPSFCSTWIFTDEGLYITTTLLFSWATIERNILIFHSQLVSTKYKFILFHCLPIIFVLLYCICYNAIVVIFPPCKDEFQYTELMCGAPLCYLEENRAVAIWDVIVNDLIPTIIIIVCSITLLLRFLYQKYRMNQPIRWRNYRKMIIQLLSISVLYLVIYIPRLLMEFIYLCGVPEEVGADFMLYAEFFAYYGNFLLPFVCAGSMPGLQKKINKIFPCCRRLMRTVGPQTVSLSPCTDGQPAKTNAVI